MSNPAKPRRRTARAWARLIAAWQKSGKTADEFAAARGLTARTLTWWKWRLSSRQAPKPPPPLRLVPIQLEPSKTPLDTPPPPALPRDGPPTWEIVTARGHVLRVYREIGKLELDAVLTAFGLGEEPR